MKIEWAFSERCSRRHSLGLDQPTSGRSIPRGCMTLRSGRLEERGQSAQREEQRLPVLLQGEEQHKFGASQLGGLTDQQLSAAGRLSTAGSLQAWVHLGEGADCPPQSRPFGGKLETAR